MVGKMSNSGHYTLCPFFKSEHGRRLSCEDCDHYFRTAEEKHEYMLMFCDRDFGACRYAIVLKALWEEIDINPVKGMELFSEHQIQAYKKELRKVAAWAKPSK